MRLYELLEEMQPLVRTTGSVVAGEVRDIAEYAMKHCKPWINEVASSGLIFYRGVQHSRNMAAFTKDVRTDRNPKDSIELAHEAYNAIIQAAGGVANRDNALFCLSGERDAAGYGNVFVVMPIGDYSYTWSRLWHDWNIQNADDLIDYVDPLVKDDIMVGPTEEEINMAYQKELEYLEAAIQR